MSVEEDQRLPVAKLRCDSCKNTVQQSINKQWDTGIKWLISSVAQMYLFLLLSFHGADNINIWFDPKIDPEIYAHVHKMMFTLCIAKLSLLFQCIITIVVTFSKICRVGMWWYIRSVSFVGLGNIIQHKLWKILAKFHIDATLSISHTATCYNIILLLMQCSTEI